MNDKELAEYNQLINERERLRSQLNLIELRNEVARMKHRLRREGPSSDDSRAER